ncbi:MAG: DUF4881 domain-containing protein [Desulfovibrio sp.]|nr:DUF4881 domain-containing protein [Desulfovibrio sp.]
MRTRNLMLTIVLAASMGLAACSGEDYGKTIAQGRCVAFADGKVTFVKDSNTDPKKSANYENKALTFKLPSDPKEIGPEPQAGSFIDFDADKKEVKVFKDGNLVTSPVEIVNVEKGIENFNSKVKGKKFPMINADKKEVTIYIKKTLATFKAPADLPLDEAFWVKGDDVRVFFKEEGKALRFMNITKTNIFKK